MGKLLVSGMEKPMFSGATATSDQISLGEGDGFFNRSGWGKIHEKEHFRMTAIFSGFRVKRWTSTWNVPGYVLLIY